jgi:hypothetical protein
MKSLALNVTLTLGLLTTSLAVGGTLAGNVSLILTNWGTFWCTSVQCAHTPKKDLEGYWWAPTLAVTRHHVPIFRQTCDVVPNQPNTWDCRTSRDVTAAMRGLSLDVLWQWIFDDIAIARRPARR